MCTAGHVAARLTELIKEYLKQAQDKQNPLVCQLIEEYLSGRREIEREDSSPSVLTVLKVSLGSIAQLAQSNSMIIYFLKSCTSCLINIFDPLKKWNINEKKGKNKR